MGLDILYIIIRLECQFGIKLRIEEWDEAASKQYPFDITAGEIHFLIGAKLQADGRAVPETIWPEIQAVLADALGLSPMHIKPESWLFRDLDRMRL